MMLLIEMCIMIHQHPSILLCVYLTRDEPEYSLRTDALQITVRIKLAFETGTQVQQRGWVATHQLGTAALYFSSHEQMFYNDDVLSHRTAFSFLAQEFYKRG